MRWSNDRLGQTNSTERKTQLQTDGWGYETSYTGSKFFDENSDFSNGGHVKSQDLSATSMSLLEQAQAKDNDAWERLANIYTPLLEGWVKRGGLQDSDRADVVQNVLRSVVKGLGRFKKELSSDTFRGWLFTITRNEIRDFYRGRAHDQARGGSSGVQRLATIPDWISADDAIEEIDVDESVESEMIRRASDLIRQDFTEQTWTAFWRATVDGDSATDIAADLNIKPGAVRQAKLRVLMRFREVIES